MSAGVNKWIGIGNVCSEPESRKLANGGTVTSVRIACNDRYKNKTSGEMVDKTEFVRVTFFGRLAEIAGEYLKKGSQVYVEGRLKTDKYTDKEGIERYATGIVASELQLLGGKQDREAKPAATTVDSDPFGDEIPF